MQLQDPKKEKIANELLSSGKSPIELAKAAQGDLLVLSSIAWKKALLLRFDEAIALVELGAYAGAVAQQTAFTAPHLTMNVHEAQFRYFRKKYEKDPDQWRSDRSAYSKQLGDEKNEAGEALFSAKEIAGCLIERGFGDDVVNNYWPEK